MLLMMAVDQPTVPAIFEKLGGPSSVARILNVGASTASEMKRRKSIPVRYWPALIEWARSSGKELSEADLVTAHASRPFPASEGDGALSDEAAA